MQITEAGLDFFYEKMKKASHPSIASGNAAPRMAGLLKWKGEVMKKIWIMGLVGLFALFGNPGAQADGVLYLPVEGREQPEDGLFKDIYVALGNALHERDVKLYEENNINGPLSRAEAKAKLADLNGRKISTALLFSLEHRKRDKGKRVRERLVSTVRVIEVPSLKVIDKIQVKSPIAVLDEFDCHKTCRDMVMARHVRHMMDKLKPKVIAALNQVPPRVRAGGSETFEGSLELTLRGFRENEIRHIEERLFALDSTYDLSTLDGGSKPVFRLERRDAEKTVRQDLSDVLAQLDLQARIQEGPGRVTLIKIPKDMAYRD